MKKLLLTAALICIAAPAMAQTTSTTPSGAPAVATTAPAKGENFADRKAKILSRISQHMTELQTRQSCVTAASTPDALKACAPAGGHGGHHGCGEEDEAAPAAK